jgi:hypothetical protein
MKLAKDDVLLVVLKIINVYNFENITRELFLLHYLFYC